MTGIVKIEQRRKGRDGESYYSIITWSTFISAKDRQSIVENYKQQFNIDNYTICLVIAPDANGATRKPFKYSPIKHIK